MQATLRNDTPHILELHGVEDRRIVLAPLEQRQFADVSGFDFSAATRAGIMSHWQDLPSDIAEKLLGTGFGLGFLGTFGCVALASKGPWFGIPPETWPAIVWGAGALLLLAIVGLQAIYLTKSRRLVLRFLTQMLSLLAILAIGLGLPCATVYYFGHGRTLLQSATPELFIRLLQVGFIATASLLPVLLYFLFDRYQLSTIRHRLYRDLFRLDRGLKTRAEIDARYGLQIREAYGPEDQGRGRLAPGTRWPVLVCAFVITMGWIIAFRPVGQVDERLLQDPLLTAQSTWTFGFLGAYFFGLQLIARRYARGELKPKTYGYITVRILTVAVLSWLLDVLFGNLLTTKLTVAFLIGILPDEFFTLLREWFRGRVAGSVPVEREKRSLKQLASIVPEPEKHPLTRLEGIDLYDRARLEQEGIVNVEGLAHHELIQLVLESSVPVPRLVDWMDQAILYLHVIEDADDSARKKLRTYGIRTATDLLACWDAADARGELDEFKKLLGGDAKPYRLEVIRDALLDDEWLDRVKDWRKDAQPDTITVTAGLQTFEAWLRWAATLEQEKRYQDALHALDAALQLRDAAEPRSQLARLLASAPVDSLRDPARARVHARRAFELAQGELDVLERLIEVHETLEDWAEAAKMAEAAVEALGDSNASSTKERRRKLEDRRQAFLKKIPAPPPQPAIDDGPRTATVVELQKPGGP